MFDKTKPVTLSIKDFLVRKMAVKMMISEDIIDKVVSFQAADVNRATKQFNEIEISGFGKLIFSESSAQKNLTRIEAKVDVYKEQLLSCPPETKKYYDLKRKCDSLIEFVAHLKNKINHVKQV